MLKHFDFAFIFFPQNEAGFQLKILHVSTKIFRQVDFPTVFRRIWVRLTNALLFYCKCTLYVNSRRWQHRCCRASR